MDVSGLVRRVDELSESFGASDSLFVWARKRKVIGLREERMADRSWSVVAGGAPHSERSGLE